MSSLRFSLSLLSLFLTAFVVSPVAAQWAGQPAAGPAGYDGPANRLQQLEAELASLHARLDQMAVRPVVAYGPGSSCDSGCGGRCDAGGGDGGCGGCCEVDCCGCESYDSGLYFGAEVVFAKPHYKESYQTTLLDPGTSATTLLPFNFDHDATPRVWLGFVDSEGRGARVRFWQLDQDVTEPTQILSGSSVPTASVVTVILPASITAGFNGAGAVLQVNHGLEYRTFDLEGTQELRVGATELTMGAGIRYAKVDQTFNAVVSGGAATQLTWQRRFEGVGVTLSADGRRPLGDRGFAAVGSFRGALLFGRKDMDRTVVNNSAPSGTDGSVTLDNGDDVFGGGELGLGLEWRREIGCRTFFARGMYEGQLWTDGGAPTLTFLGFEGFALAAGVHF